MISHSTWEPATQGERETKSSRVESVFSVPVVRACCSFFSNII